MRNKFNNNPATSQLRWVILLLAITVILPTVCLLWFMTEAVKNERLAVRQKLIDVYQEKSRPLVEHLQQKYLEFEQGIQRLEEVSPFSFFVDFCNYKEYAEGLVIYDNNDQIIFPVLSEKTYHIDAKKFKKAWTAEFVDGDYIKAAKEYEQKIMGSSIPYEVFYGRSAMIRCYEKAEAIEKAIDLCRELAYPGKHIADEFAWSDVIRARLRLVQLYQKHDTIVFEKEAVQLLSDVTGNLQKKTLISEVRVFVLSKLIELIDEAGLGQKQLERIVTAEKMLQAELMSLHAAENLLTKAVLGRLQEKTLRTIDDSQQTYGMLFKTGNRKVVLICQRSSIASVLKYIAERLSDSTATVSVFDDQSKVVFGEDRDISESFLTIRPNVYLGQWRLCFFFRNSNVFDQAAGKQAAIYTWTGLLVVLLILVSGAIATQTISRQIKLNRLKNDFIATVTHELKTPLSSMRVLVDTLLEGSYNDREQAKEYLELISKENLRLSRLIDNFLTFSRMERNKQAFDIVKTSPAEIANAAADAVQTKFDDENCKFTLMIDEDLPSVSADKDAMVTVLVNLLDNAYKYSYDDKQIELKVSCSEGLVCFTVTDNGIGMTARQIKKAFERFYQADSSLSRQAEGTGLGLSIVKFIVDAHKGRVNIESKQSKGSTFTVKLAAVD